MNGRHKPVLLFLNSVVTGMALVAMSRPEHFWESQIFIAFFGSMAIYEVWSLRKLLQAHENVELALVDYIKAIKPEVTHIKVE